MAAHSAEVASKGGGVQSEAQTAARLAGLGQHDPQRGTSTGARAYSPGRDWVGDTTRYVQRIIRFEPAVFRDIRNDVTATPIAVFLAALATFVFGLGGWLWLEVEFDGTGEDFWKSALAGSGISVGLWLVGALVATGILRSFYRKPIRFDEVVRVTGAATTVLAIGFFMFIPEISFGISLLAVGLWIAATILALQAAFELDPREALVSGISCFAAWGVFLPLIVTENDTLGPGIWISEGAIDAMRTLFDLYNR